MSSSDPDLIVLNLIRLKVFRFFPIRFWRKNIGRPCMARRNTDVNKIRGIVIGELTIIIARSKVLFFIRPPVVPFLIQLTRLRKAILVRKDHCRLLPIIGLRSFYCGCLHKIKYRILLGKYLYMDDR